MQEKTIDKLSNSISLTLQQKLKQMKRELQEQRQGMLQGRQNWQLEAKSLKQVKKDQKRRLGAIFIEYSAADHAKQMLK